MGIEEKAKFDPIVQHLIDRGLYDQASAVKVVADVTEAMRLMRLARYEEYKGKKVRVDVEGLKVDCLVKDTKFTEKDGLMFQVEPVAGKGHIWVSRLVEVVK